VGFSVSNGALILTLAKAIIILFHTPRPKGRGYYFLISFPIIFVSSPAFQGGGLQLTKFRALAQKYI